jgi:hypothetical protein
MAVYLAAAVSALGRALFRDPLFDPSCWDNCTDNVFVARSLRTLLIKIRDSTEGRLLLTAFPRSGRGRTFGHKVELRRESECESQQHSPP